MAHKTSAVQVLKATYTALNVNSLTSLLGADGVRNGIPDDPAYPYVRIESPLGNRWDTFGKAGKERFVFVHAFGQKTPLELFTILDEVVNLLHYVALSVTGHNLARYQFDEDFDGSDETVQGKMTYHKVARFKVNVQET